VPDPSIAVAVGLVLVGIVIGIIRSDPSATEPPTRLEDDEDRATFGR